MASVDAVVARALPAWYCRGTSGVSGTSCSPRGLGGDCFLEPPKDQDRPDLKRKEDGLADGVAKASVWDFLFNFHSSWPPKSAEEGAVDALLCREELSVELVLVVLDDPLPLAKESAQSPPWAPFLGTSSRDTSYRGYQDSGAP